MLQCEGGKIIIDRASRKHPGTGWACDASSKMAKNDDFGGSRAGGSEKGRKMTKKGAGRRSVGVATFPTDLYSI